MKIIDLLNKIANGEEVPKFIKYDNSIFRLKESDFKYYYVDEYNTLFEEMIVLENLNNEIEIIEEDKKIEKIKSLNNVGGCPNIVYFGDNQQLNNHILKDKINEIIDHINKENDK
jgi:hypothetical protein